MNNTEISEQQLIEFQTRMQNILDPLNQISNLQANKTAWEQQFNNNKFAKFTLAKNKKDSTILGAVVGGVLFMYVGLSLISVVNNKILAFITIVFICIVIGIITKLIYFSSQESKRKIGEKITNNSTQNIAEINRRINQLLTQYGNEIVALLPPDYQYYIAANYIYSCFLNGRAFTMS